MRDYDLLLSHGNAAQIEKLKANEHKRGFDDVDIKYATKRIIDEYTELSHEVFTEKKNYEKIRHEAADIANFAHMIILACDNKTRPHKHGKKY